MENTLNQAYVKRTQKDYTISFKLQVVQEVESGELSIHGSLLMYGIQSHATVLRWVIKYETVARYRMSSKAVFGV